MTNWLREELSRPVTTLEEVGRQRGNAPAPTPKIGASMQDQTNAGWDRQGLAATLILAAPILARRVERFIDFEENSIDFRAMLESSPWSSSEAIMIRAAWDLFNGDEHCSLDELTITLDNGNLQIVLDAIRIRRGWPLERRADD